MDIYRAVNDFLRRHPALKPTAGPHFVEAPAPNPSGFPVRLEIGQAGIEVRLGGWSEVFDNAEDAYECFVFAYSPLCRLRVESHNGKPHAWTLEYKTEDGWVADRTVGRAPKWPWARKKQVHYLHNILRD